MNTAFPKTDHGTLTVRIPLSIRRRGGRRVVVTPGGSTVGRPKAHVDDAIVNALARSFRWCRLIESGIYASIEELATAERINPSYLGRVLRLSLLAPAIVEDLLDGRSASLTLAKLMKPFPIAWSEQERWAVEASPVTRLRHRNKQIRSTGFQMEGSGSPQRPSTRSLRPRTDNQE